MMPRLTKPDPYPSDGSFGPVLLRLAWHSSGTYDKDTKTGGRYAHHISLLSLSHVTHAVIPVCSNYATMRFEPEALHGANAGLHVARGIMEKIKQEFDWISYGDLWTLGGVAAIQVCSLFLVYEPSELILVRRKCLDPRFRGDLDVSMDMLTM